MSKDSTRTMPLMGHLTELRKRITYCAVVIVIACIACFVEKKYIFAVLMHPLAHTSYAGQKPVAFTVTEPFMAILKISIYAGLLISLPFLLYQFWAFILPGLYERERKSVFPYMGLSTGLFLGGVVFGYYIVLPVGLKWLLNFSSGQFTVMLHIDGIVSFISLFLLAFGVVFELPLVMMLLAWAGIVDYKKMRKWRKWAVLVNAVIAMVITPSQDPISMMLMLVPLLILYEFGIGLSVIVYRRRERRALAPATADAGETGA